MTRFKPAQFAAAATAGTPKNAVDFGNEHAWHAYQEKWLAVFWPHETLPPVGAMQRRLRWTAATRQHAKIKAARLVLADSTIVLVAPAQSVQSTTYVVEKATDVAAAAAAAAASTTAQAVVAASPRAVRDGALGGNDFARSEGVPTHALPRPACQAAALLSFSFLPISFPSTFEWHHHRVIQT